MSAPAIAWWRRLHVRLTAVVLLLLLTAGVALMALSRHYAAAGSLEATQRLHLDLARSIVRSEPRPLIAANGEPDRKAMAAMAMHAMAINPALEVYLLDTEGRVIAHALDAPGVLASRVDLAPVRPLAARDAARPRLPLLGDDPRRPGERNVVSVEGLSAEGRMTGYLYVVLQGQTQQAIASHLADSQAWRVAALLGTLALAGAALAAAWLLHRLTRPLRQLTQELRSFHAEPDPTPAQGGDEVGALADATRHMQQRIDEQFARLEASDRLRRELVSSISHDLHTPLAGIQGYVETLLLRGGQLDGAAREQHLRTVLRHCQRLHRRIADLFELSMLDAGQRVPQLEAFCLAELLQDVMQDYRLQAQQCGVTIALDAGSHAQARVRADIALIERVLQNLVDNALRHTGAGGSVRLAIEAAHPQQLMLTISDTGAGIAPEHLPHIFERYWRPGEAEPQDAPSRSAGLGLAIVKRIVELHGSVIRVRSVPQQGTTFTFALPQAV